MLTKPYLLFGCGRLILYKKQNEGTQHFMIQDVCYEDAPKTVAAKKAMKDAGEKEFIWFFLTPADQ